MEWGRVSTASIVGMIFTLLVSFGIPIFLMILVRIKTRARISVFFIGCGFFIVFALILEQILHAIVFAVAGHILPSSIILYGLYGGLAAALFEETGRFIAMKFCMKKCLDKNNALMYGVGHGGVEAILLVGLTYVNNLIYSMMINSGGLQQTMSLLEPSMQETLYMQVQVLWQLPAYQFYLGGVERLLAIVLQICLSVFVYKAVKTGRKKFFAGAFLIHFMVDFLTIETVRLGLPTWAVELEVLVITVVIAIFTVKLYKADKES
ncbi:MAG: YhfC family intramembrane metalloprotease [Lachnospiraceae bacterium]|nr:YhfC family intramembrane metalloprotease [Lachnospiraceae bacterium]